MEPDPVVADVAVTWMGATGAALYLRSLSSAGWREHKAAISLASLLTLLLFLRGVAWWQSEPTLTRVVLAVATLLPLSATLFCERILRRHHPLWLKLLSVLVSGTFFVFNLAVGLTGQLVWQLAFIAGFATVVFANGVLLMRLRNAQLGANESRLARALVIVALLSVPLLISDFRTLIGYPPVRLGGIGVLLFVYVMLSAAANRLSRWRMAMDLSGWLLAAAALSATFAALGGLDPETFRLRFWLGLPVAYAWLLLTLAFNAMRSLSPYHLANGFLRWLQTTPLQDIEAFVASLEAYPATKDYRALRAGDLRNYDIDLLWSNATAEEPITIQCARAQVSSPQLETSCSLVLIRAHGDDPFAAGRAWYRFWLALTARGLAAVPMSSLADEPASRMRLMKAFPQPEGQVLLNAMRVGLMPAAVPVSARLPVEELLID